MIELDCLLGTMLGSSPIGAVWLLKEVGVKPKRSSSAAVSLKFYRSGWLVVVCLCAWYYSLYKLLSPRWCEGALRMEGSGSGRQVCAASDAELVNGVESKCSS